MVPAVLAMSDQSEPAPLCDRIAAAMAALAVELDALGHRGVLHCENANLRE